MNTARSTRATYVAAFLLGALIALLLATPGRSAEPAALERIAVVRFTAESDGQLARQDALLHAMAAGEADANRHVAAHLIELHLGA